MKRFRFQLETAFEWRRRRMEQEQLRLEEMESQDAALHAEMEHTDRNYHESRKQIMEAPTLLAADLCGLAGYRDAMDVRKQRISRERAKLEAEIRRQRAVMLEATRQYRLLEKLRERRLQEWRKECDHELELEAGELFLSKWKRGPTEPSEGW